MDYSMLRTGLFDDYYAGHVICFKMISEKALKNSF